MNYPERSDMVIVKVTQILDYGVFVELLEYNNIRGFVHVSNVSSSWVKNIRNFVKINQVRSAKVLNVDPEKKQIDLSFSGITPQRDQQKLAEFRQYNREEKLITLLAKQEKKPFAEVWKEVAEPLAEEYDSFYEALEKIALGADVSALIPKKWFALLKDLVEKNIVVAQKTVKGKIKASSLNSNGLEDIKKVFEEFEAIKNCEVSYLGAGAYHISCSAPTFKEAEKKLMSGVEAAQKKAKKLEVAFEFKKEEND